MEINRQNQLKLSQLRIMVAVADYANFSEAALSLDMSQSAVSHAIAALEEHLGVVVFVRGRHGARLTPVGEQITELAREILQRVDAVYKVVEGDRTLKGGHIRVATFRSVASHYLPAVIARFRQQYPDTILTIDEKLDSPHVEQALRDGLADIGLTVLPVEADLEAWEVLQDEFIALMPPHFQLKGDSLTWKELLSQPLIIPSSASVLMQKLYEHAATHGYKLTPTYRVRTDSTIVGMVAQGIGASILPWLSAQPIPTGVHVFSLPVPLKRPVGAAILADALHSPIVFAFIDMLKNQQGKPSAAARSPNANP